MPDDVTPETSQDARGPGSGQDFSTRAHRLIPGGAHTYSKGDDQFPANAPRALARGKGARVWDPAGNEFVDWGMGINSVLIGHAEDVIDEAAIAALRRGQNFSRPTPLEVETAEAVLALFDGMDMIKFAKNGSDANTAAVRLARAVTGRDLIAYDESAPFLSIHDWFIGNTPMNAGVPEAVRGLSVSFRFNDLAGAERLFAAHPARLAAVILEPCREVRPVAGFLEGLRRLCDRHGTILIFDEVVTAFRYSLSGAYALFGVRPDLLAIGKGMANGYALTALAGRREVMERGGIHHDKERCFLLSTTNGAEQSALAAGLATMHFYRRHDVIGHLARTGRQVMDALREAASRHGVGEYLTAASDFPSRPALQCLDAARRPSREYRTLFLQEMIRGGVFMPWICPSFRHGDSELTQTAEAFDAACAVYRRAIEQRSVADLLVGPPAKPVFRPYN
jgi:glutamate-1-semialdehyde 2,1-aminomutase